MSSVNKLENSNGKQETQVNIHGIIANSRTRFKR